MTIAERIRLKRHELQLSQTELAERADYCDKTRISKIENSGNDISMKQVKRIAKALGVSSAYLMGWETEQGEQTLQGQVVDAYVFNERLSSYSHEQITQALDFLDVFLKASPETQIAVLTLLKPQ